MLSSWASYQMITTMRECVCVCVQPFTSDQSASTCRQKHSLPPLPIWSKGSRVATVLEMTSTKCVCVCEDEFLCAWYAWCPSCSSSLGCGSLWLDLWPGHLTFPVLTAPRSPSCEIDCVCEHICALATSWRCSAHFEWKKPDKHICLFPHSVGSYVVSSYHCPICSHFNSALWNLSITALPFFCSQIPCPLCRRREELHQHRLTQYPYMYLGRRRLGRHTTIVKNT